MYMSMRAVAASEVVSKDSGLEDTWVVKIATTDQLKKSGFRDWFQMEGK